MLAGTLFQVNTFETWNAEPRVIHSTDPAGIAYYPPSDRLLIADSEIDENVEFNGNNVFETDRNGTTVSNEYWPGNDPEPTGITWNEVDGFYYITNDDAKTISRFDENLSSLNATVDSRRFGVNDPEDITSDPAGLLYVVSGHPPLVSVFDSNFNFRRSFPTSLQMQDAEGIAYDKQRDHLFLVSAVDQRIFEYTLNGDFVEEYTLDVLQPMPNTPQGLTFGPCTDSAELQCLYIADGGRDNAADGRIYEVRVGETWEPYRSPRYDQDSYSFGPIREDMPRGRLVGTVTAIDPAGGALTYSIIGGNAEGKFTIGTSSGIITTANALDYEDTANYTLVVKAGTNGRTAKSMVEVHIAVGNVTSEVRPADPITLAFQNGVFPLFTYTGSEDTKIRGDLPTTVQGTSRKLEIDGKPDMTALVKWDISQIPAGSTIKSVSITINVLNTSTHLFNLYEVFQPWVESTTTFNEFDAGMPWQVAGAVGPKDRGALTLGTIAAPSLGALTIHLNRLGVALVQRWANNPMQNYGLAFQEYFDDSTDDLVFSSTESINALLRPKLTVVYASAANSSLRWTNPLNAYDVNDDKFVTPRDVLVIINRLNQYGDIDLADDEGNSKPDSYPDVSGDGAVTPLDVLLVINYLSELSAGEAEAMSPDLASWEIGAPTTVLAVADGEILRSHRVKVVQAVSAWTTDAIDLRIHSLQLAGRLPGTLQPRDICDCDERPTINRNSASFTAEQRPPVLTDDMLQSSSLHDSLVGGHQRFVGLDDGVLDAITDRFGDHGLINLA